MQPQPSPPVLPPRLPPMADPAEPATPRALWPTFLRRTLCDEAIRREQAPPDVEK